MWAATSTTCSTPAATGLLVLGDVCGKGAGAAALTAMVRYSLRAAAIQGRQPAAILVRLNDAILRQSEDERFCTVAYARLVHDVPRRAGHGVVRRPPAAVGGPGRRKGRPGWAARRAARAVPRNPAGGGDDAVGSRRRSGAATPTGSPRPTATVSCSARNGWSTALAAQAGRAGRGHRRRGAWAPCRDSPAAPAVTTWPCSSCGSTTSDVS